MVDEYEHDYRIIKRLVDGISMEKHILFEFLLEKNLLGEWDKWCNEKSLREKMH